MEPEAEIAVVGAGAAGLMAAIFAAESSGPHRRVVAFDGMKKIGAKILISGGGRCNVTHHAVSPADFNGSASPRIAKVLRTFDIPQTIEFFRTAGVELKREESGKLFPVSDRAATVLTALVGRLEEKGAELLTDHRVLKIGRKEGQGFAITTTGGSWRARAVIMATGGQSIPKTGSDGFGFHLARELGHSVTALYPALVPLTLHPEHWLLQLSGITVDAVLSLLTEGGKLIRREEGSLLLTHWGLSGPLALDMSRHWISRKEAGERVMMSVSWLPGSGFAPLEGLLLAEAAARPRAAVLTVLKSLLPERLAAGILQHEVRVDPSTMMNSLTREARRAIAHAVTGLPIAISGDRGFGYAEVTAGGVPLAEVDGSTLESKSCPGLFFCGEILDVDGRIGGFNFQWAWASGRLAGISAARRLEKASL